jgi:hypothetical protein
MMRNGKKIFLIVFLVLVYMAQIWAIDSYFNPNNKALAQQDLNLLFDVLYDIKPPELASCISFIRTSGMASKEIADIIYNWDPDDYEGVIAAVIRSKITRLADRLKNMRYRELVRSIDKIQNSTLTTGQIVSIFRQIKKNKKG